MTANQGDGEGETTIEAVHFERCAECGTTLDSGEWQPVELVESEDATHLRAFCSEACHQAFLESA